MHRIYIKDFEDLYNRKTEWEKLKNKAVLVTGAYGMLASYLVFYLIYLNEKHDYSINIYAQGRNLSKMKERFDDYMDREYFYPVTFSLDEKITLNQNIDYIIHAAGISNPNFYKSNPVEVSTPNVVGTYNLLQYARDKKIEGFLFFSSGDVYGKMSSQGTDITEDMMGVVDPLAEHSCYGEAKRMGECFVASFAREYNVPAFSARIAHTYGPTMDIDNDPRVFASFVKNIVNNEDIVMLSDGMAKRPFCYITDAIEAFFIILFRGNSGESYNVCNTDAFISVKELADILVSLYPEKELNVIRKSRAENSNYLEASFNKENKPIENKLLELGWTRDILPAEGFRRVVDFFED